MDEKKIERTPTGTHTTIDRTVTQPSGGNGTMWFVLGGLVVLIAIIAYFVMGSGTVPTSTATPSAGGDVSISVETNDAPAADPAPAETAPAETAPAEPAPAAD